jgi:hypothetical protein
MLNATRFLLELFGAGLRLSGRKIFTPELTPELVLAFAESGG